MPQTNKSTPSHYHNRINQVFAFIEQNLEADLSLQTVAEVACFSPFHFHRIFKFMTDETLNGYVTRKRIEKSAADVLHTNRSATELAHNYGFSDISAYSKAFKKYFGLSPTAFKKQNPHRHSKIRQLESKNGQAYPTPEKYISVLNHLKNWMHMNATIEVKEMPNMPLAYVSCMGSQNLGGAFDKLIRWATPKGLMHEQAKLLTVYYDSFKITEAGKVRMNAALVLEQSIELRGEIGQTTLEPGKCIVARFEIGVHEFEKSWTGLFLWMNENGYTKADRPPFEVYHNNFNEHPKKIAIVDFCIPVE